jgi:hypothetical protein
VVVPRCPAPRRDGRVGGALAATQEGRLCKRHAALADQWGEEAVLAGTHPGARPKKAAKPMLAEPSNDNSAPSLNGNGPVSPAEVRSRLGELVAGNLGELEKVLLDVALGASRGVWVTTQCKAFGRDGRNEVTIPATACGSTRSRSSCNKA